MSRSIPLIGILCLLEMMAYMAFATPIADTRHNLSVTGPGPVRARAEQDICIFCHTPHRALPNAPLWNRGNIGGGYTPYTSSTAVASPGQPTGDSILCLSCHDGTIALGNVRSRGKHIEMTGGVITMPIQATDHGRRPPGRPAPGYLGKDLSDDHPISFKYTSSLASQNGELVDPGLLNKPIKLDANGELQCTTCHNAHDDTYDHFLVMSNQESALCVSCHRKNYWSESSHKLSSAVWNGVYPDPWPLAGTGNHNVADIACANCHVSHTAGGKERLLIYNEEEENCNACHNGNVAKLNVQADFSKSSIHPVMETTGVHDPTEDAVIKFRHVECADCHEPHAVSDVDNANIPGVLTNVRGIDIAGVEIQPITESYELCFRCHGDSTGKPPPSTPRDLEQTNTRLEFDPGNPSFHPVAGPGRSANVPSLIEPWTESSTMTCGDCHNSNNSIDAGGTGPNGPHGSNYSPILIRQYELGDNTNESPSTFALCYGCHDRNKLLSDDNYKHHARHVPMTSCNTCHDPHGISATQGNDINNARLINFNTTIVTTNSNGELFWESRGVFTGSCSLLCHNFNHQDSSY